MIDNAVENSTSYNSDQEISIAPEEGDDLAFIDPPATAPMMYPYDTGPSVYDNIPKCENTGLYYPSTATMELLVTYDDGLSPTSVQEENLHELNADDPEPVFCRICREGLHDIDYDFEMEGGKGNNNNATTSTSDNNTSSATTHNQDMQRTTVTETAVPSRTTSQSLDNQPTQNSYYGQNESIN